jgi:type III secretion system FlhB-like substrate exporter
MAIKKAAAIAYTKDLPAPMVLAKGQGIQAERIVAIAQDRGIEVVRDDILVELIDKSASAGDFIPPWCWTAVAKILAFVVAEEGK